MSGGHSCESLSSLPDATALQQTIPLQKTYAMMRYESRLSLERLHLAFDNSDPTILFKLKLLYGVSGMRENDPPLGRPTSSA
jgi:hypothetical protein